jgi:hypothetical protein
MGAKSKRRSKEYSPMAPGNQPPSTEFPTTKVKSFTFVGKVLVVLVFPFCVGVLGLLATYLDKSNADQKMRIERDFALPFAVTLLLTVVIGFQTNGFTTKPQPLVLWPKVRKQKKVRHVHVVKGQDPNHQGKDQGEKKD